jgi:hypothetical protein
LEIDGLHPPPPHTHTTKNCEIQPVIVGKYNIYTVDNITRHIKLNYTQCTPVLSLIDESYKVMGKVLFDFNQ